ncbi:MAG: sigma-54-dependent Fis family transcriptional regulator [Myxococcales bacterium]|nr:sigma-54-dependent Fis family transcriptional regulator [Myxococcales bacterium]
MAANSEVFGTKGDDESAQKRAETRLDDGTAMTLFLSGAGASQERADQALTAARQVLEEGRSGGPSRAAKSTSSTRSMVGKSPAMQNLSKLLDRIRRTSATVLITGENGTGKELVARRIHQDSDRSRKAFVATNCSALNDNLLESELFGHKRGAFTDASTDKQGLFQVADGGTFFMDEVGDMSASLQVKLLRVLQEGAFMPVGGTKTSHVDVRVIAATNRDLDVRVGREEFRFDLLTRLRRLRIRVPPLRERLEDVPLLATRFASARAGRPVTLHRQLAFALLEHAWPGNVRELDAVMERAVVLSGGERQLRFDPSLLATVPVREAPRGRRASPVVFAGVRPTPLELGTLLRNQGGNVTHLARELGVARHTLYRWLKEADIALDDFR